MSKKLILAAAGFILIGIIIGVVITSRLDWTDRGVAEIKREIVLGSQKGISKELLQLQNTSQAFVRVAEEVIPTVVSIHSSRIVHSLEMRRFSPDQGLWDFFRFEIPRRFRQEGSGSGIIVTPDGYILTNTHVVRGAERIRVTLDDNRDFDAELIGADPLTEVAVVKIEGKDLPVARLGDSDQLRVGEWVLAIGNPMELKSTVTAGIVSAIGREVDVIRDHFAIENFIQTDAVINPGNSGGALVNLKGEVIGVNTAIATQTGYYQGYGFAIPINLAKKVMRDLITKGRVIRGYLGIAMLAMDEKKARALNMEKPRGVFIDRVLEDGPAKKAGVKPMDVLLAINGKEVSKPNQVQSIVAKKNPGDEVELTLIRKGKEIKIEVTLGEKRTDVIAANTKKTKRPKSSDLGIVVEELTEERAKEWGLSVKGGVVVVAVQPYSPAEEAGIREGDIIIAVNGQKVKSIKELKKLISELRGEEVAVFCIVRGGDITHAFVEIQGR